VFFSLVFSCVILFLYYYFGLFFCLVVFVCFLYYSCSFFVGFVMNVSAEVRASGLGFWKVLLIVVVATVVATLLVVWVVKSYIFPSEFKPVSLSVKEERVLDDKLGRLGVGSGSRALKPERYSESGASRDVRFSEKELNSLIARNSDLASRLAIDLSKDLASAKLLFPLDPDFPFFGGKTLRISAGLELRYSNDRPVVVLKGVSVWGVPVPSAWLGDLKNVDLVHEFGSDEGFWDSFARGVELVEVEDGALRIRLRE